MSPVAEPALRLPYPGLRSFQRDESDLFFGREGSVNEMINRLRPNHFLAVLGTSGSGKSSLVRIGLLDGLELGLLAEAGSSWRIADFTPGANPLRNLARELARLSGGSDIEADFLQAFLARGPRSVIEWCRDGHLKRGANLLLLVDQFEELFRYQDYAERQAAEAFVALLIESARNREVPIYVVITMRSEYLGACALVEGLAEIINDGQYLTPRLNRGQCREAIVGPAAVCGTVIEEALVNRLLNDLEDFAPWDDRDSGDQLDRLVRRADQLPLLQHTLNRLWLRTDAAHGNKAEPIVLRLADYEAIGGLRGAINAHAEEILAELGPSLLPRAETVFRALTDGKSIANAVRRPTRFNELVAVCDGDEPGVRAVVDAFRETGVNFLRPDAAQPLAADTIIDISHESLIRQWRRLSGWLQDEGREAQEWTRLGEAAARYRAGEGARYHGQDLHVWREHPRPTAAWARRYNQPYEETLAFLDESMGADRRQRRLRYAAIVAGFVVVVGFGGGGLFFTQLANKNAELSSLASQLAQQNKDLEKASVDLRAQTALANMNLEVAKQAKSDLDRLVAEASSVFRASVDSNIGEYQHAGNWPAAGALLGALLKQTGTGAGADRKYNDAILHAVRLRLAAQSAFPVWAAANPDAMLKLQADGLQRDGRLALSVADAESTEVRLVDRLTGAIVAETNLPEGESPDLSALQLVTPDGEEAVIVTAARRVFLWRVAEGQLVDFGEIAAGGAAIRSLALDRGAGHIAAALYEEDSEVVLLQSDPPGKLRSWLLSNIDGLSDAGSDSRNPTFNATAIGFWGGGLIVAFDNADGGHRFAALGIDDDNAALLPDTLLSVLPTPDGRMLIAVDGKACTADGESALVGSDGSPAAVVSAGCVGTLRFPDGALAPLGDVITGSDSPPARPSMALADVWPLSADDGGPGYRVVLDDGTIAGPDNNKNAPRFVIDLRLDGSMVTPLAPERPERGLDAPLALTGDGAARAFIKATPAEAWLPLVPDDGGKTTVTVIDPETRAATRLAELTAVRPAGSATDTDAGLLAVGRLVEKWPTTEIGEYEEMRVARNADTLLVTAGGYAGARLAGSASTEVRLQKMTFGRDCRLAPDETPRLTELFPWSSQSPVFFGLDAAGRVLRISVRSGGQGAAAPDLQGSGQVQAPRDTATVAVACIGRVRTDTAPIAIADPGGERVMLQTNPQEFRILAAAIQSEKDFNAAPRIPLAVAAERAALVPGSPDRLATVDQSGNLTVLSADRTWREVGAARSVVVPDPVHLSATGDKLLAVGAAGEAMVIDLSTDDRDPVAAGRLPESATDYRLLADGRTVEATIAGALWRVPLPPLARLDELARYAEAIAGAVADPSDQALVALGRSLTREAESSAEGEGDLALDGDARCFLATDALLEAWRAEAGDQGMASARLTTARTDAETECTGSTAMAAMGKRLAATSHFVSPANDPWPAEWSALLHEAVAGNRLATRALLLGLQNSTDAFAGAAGEWLNGSPIAVGLVLPAEVLADAASGGAIDPELRRAAEERRQSYEPASHELLGHIAARSGGDRAKLEEAWVQYRIAEILYRHETGRDGEANRMAEMRASLARALPADVLLKSWEEAGRWIGNAALPPHEVDSSSAPPLRDRIAADGERIVALEQQHEGDDEFRLLQAYLWLNLADIDAGEDPAAAPASYTRFIDILTSLPPAADLGPAMAAALEDANRRLVELARENRFGDAKTAVALAPFMLGLAEAEGERSWDASALSAYAETLETVAALLSADPAVVPASVLDRLRFAERRFGFGFHLDDEETRAAGTAALDARLALTDLLVARDPARWDWLAAKGTTEFWIGFRIHDADTAARTEWLSSAIKDLAAAHQAAGEAFPAESLYWLTEARRWLPQRDDKEYLALVVDGIGEYAALRTIHESGAWDAPLNAAELLASNAELLAKIADTEGKLLFDEGDAWSADDPAFQASVLDGLSHIAEWDRIRRLASEAGSTWTSMNPGYANAPGYLLGTVGGHLQLGKVDVADECDRLASFLADPLRRAPAVQFRDVKLDAAVAACRSLWQGDQENPRLNYLLGRLLWQNDDWNGLALDVLKTAAAAGYPAAFNNLASYLEAPDLNVANRDAQNLDLRHAFAQRVVRAVFGDVFAYLAPLAKTPEHRAGVRWLAERAAALGSADAHIAVADLPDTSPQDRAYHLAVAATILDETDTARAEEIRGDIPPEYAVDASDRVDEEWQAEALVELPPGLVDEIKGATN